MLSRSQRVTTKEFEEVLQKGRVAHSPLFVIRFSQGGEGAARVAAVAPQKIAKTAVIRNKTRRKVYAIVHGLSAQLKSGLTIIIFAKQPALAAKPAELKEALQGVFVKAGVLR